MYELTGSEALEVGGGWNGGDFPSQGLVLPPFEMERPIEERGLPPIPDGPGVVPSFG